MGKKILCVTNSFPIHPRLKKIGSLFNDYAELNYFAWDRDMSYIQGNDIEENVFVCSSNNGYGTALKMLLGVPKFIYRFCSCLKKLNPDILIIRHWSTCFVLLLFLPRKCKVIYDVNDMPDSENERIIRVYKLFERFVIKRVDVVILSSKYYIPFYENKHPNIYVLENKVDTNLIAKKEYSCKNDCLTISFIGMVRYHEILINLIQASKGLPIKINIYGKGIDSDIVRSYCVSNNVSNVFVHGSYQYETIETLYNSSDLIYTAYPSQNENVRYSIPNKLYESLLFNKPLIASCNTALGEIVENEKIGFVVDSASVESIREMLKKILSNTALIEESRQSIILYKKSHDVYWDSYKFKAEEIINKLK